MTDTELTETWNAVKARFADVITEIEFDATKTPILWVKKDHITSVLRYLKETTGLEFWFLSDLTAYDEMGSPEEAKSRFVVVYQLASPKRNAHVRLKVRVNEGELVPTAIGVWSGANWAEREVFDMFGVRFEGHPDLRRILMDQRWEGHPLRKDYPWRKYQYYPEPEEVPMHLLEDKGHG